MLTVNQKINFRSYFMPENEDKFLMRINRTARHLWRLKSMPEFYDMDLPFFAETERLRQFRGWNKSRLFESKK